MLNQLIVRFSAECSTGFLGLVPWHKYLKKEDDCSIRSFNVLPKGNGATQTPSDIPLVMLAVVDNLLRLAGLIAVIFIVYGGIKYATSQGNPDQTSQAQSTIINALVGLIIAVTAVVFVTFIGNRITT